MTVHVGDVALIVQEALHASESVGEVSLIATPDPTQGFPNRDGRYEYVCAGRDCVRGFRVTVEMTPFADVDRSAHPEQYETTEISDDIETLLAGLEVENLSELHLLVAKGRAWDRHISRPNDVSSDESRGAAERQP